MLGDKKGPLEPNYPYGEKLRTSRYTLRGLIFCFVVALVLALGLRTIVIDPSLEKGLSSRLDILIDSNQNSTVSSESSTESQPSWFHGKCMAVDVVAGPYDGHWWSGTLAASRSCLFSDKVQYPFEYNRRTDEFRIAYQFMQSLYGSKNRVNTDLTFQGLKDLQLGPIGDPTVKNDASRPTDAPYVSRTALPKWYPAELGYRVTAVWRAILTIAMDQNSDDPVSRYITTQVPTQGVGPAAIAQYPESVRNLIMTNSPKVHSGGTLGRTWIGWNVSITGGETPPFAGIQVGYDNRMTSWQRGAAGPFSVEAAFIIATQVAGVNYRAVARAIQQGGQIDTWWSGILIPGQKVQALQCLNENAIASGERLYGKYQLSGANGQHDPRAGMYIAFDLDPMLKPDDERHNVFIFTIHALDGYSVYQIAKDSSLRDVQLTRYTPSQGSGDAKFWGPQGASNNPPPLPPKTDKANTRQVLTLFGFHDHADVIVPILAW
ncbi:hypothetical protein RhiJN_22427 [Ceratobasidium sp. AG-Ba]|nr:hypothetical protein RhiJN_22427 [Ceratobasidium sp. AG-Ba]